MYCIEYHFIGLTVQEIVKIKVFWGLFGELLFCYIFKRVQTKICRVVLNANVSLLELVAAYGKLFFHNRPSEVMKSKRTIYRKTSHKF